MMMYLWAIVVAVIAIGIFLYAEKNGNKQKKESPEDIWDNRFAKVEISKEEHEQQ